MAEQKSSSKYYIASILYLANLNISKIKSQMPIIVKLITVKSQTPKKVSPTPGPKTTAILTNSPKSKSTKTMPKKPLSDLTKN